MGELILLALLLLLGGFAILLVLAIVAIARAARALREIKELAEEVRWLRESHSKALRKIADLEKRWAEAPGERPAPAAPPVPAPEPKPAAPASAAGSRPSPPPGPPAPPRVPEFTAPQARWEIDWERFTGARLFAWIGGLALFFGVAFFVKYSFDRDLISPAMRVAAGLLLGVGIIVWGLWLARRGYDITAQTFCAVGPAILYADTYAAHQFYGFLGAGGAFAFMVLVTAVAFLLAVRLDARYIAVLGMIGGFLTPPLLSTGVDRPLGLFGYIALLDLGLSAVALRKRWGFLVGLAALGTAVTQIGWVVRFFTVAKVETGVTVFLAFAILFAVAHVLAERWKREDPWILGTGAAVPVLSMLFAFYLLQFPDLRARPGVTLTFVLLLDLLLAARALMRAELEPAHLAAGGLAFVLLFQWTVRAINPSLLPWGLAFYLAFAILHAVFPVLLQRLRSAGKPFLWGHLYPALMLLLILIPIAKSVTAPALIWPVVFLLDLVAVLAAVALGVAWVTLAVMALTMATAGVWLIRLPDAAGLPGLLLITAFFAVAFFALGVYASRRPSALGSLQEWGIAPAGGEDVRHLLQLPALSAVLPFLLLCMASVHVTIEDPSSIFGLGALLVVLLLGLVRYAGADVVAPVALIGAAAMQYVWHAHRFDAAHPLTALPWHVGFIAVFTVFPFLFERETLRRRLPWITSAFAGPVHFWLVYRSVVIAAGDALIGVLPALFAIVALAGLARLVRKVPADTTERPTLLACFGGVALLFVSLVFPLQFDKEWLTVGWALEGMALVWLFHRIPHPGLKLWGGVLLVIAFARLALNPVVWSPHPRASTAILNWYLYAYGTVTACLVAGARLWRPIEERILGSRAASVLYVLGGVLAFLLMNIEIADFFGRGRTFEFRASLALDMTYSLGWALFGLGLLVIALRTGSRGARYGSLGLLAVTVVKLFLYDLWRLGGLYRVGAFVGLAVVLILVSFLYQRYLSPGRGDGKRQGPIARAATDA